MNESVSELEIDVAQLKLQKVRAVQERGALQSQLTDIRAQCSTRLPNDKFHKLQKQRAVLAKLVVEKESEITELNALIHAQTVTVGVKKRESLSPDDLKQFRIIRDEWHEFSMERRNPEPQRRLAWKFVDQINKIIKPHFENRDET